MEKYKFKAMLAPLKEMETGKPDWLYSMSGRLQEDYYRTETYGAGRLIDTLRELLPYKPWNHIPLGNPSRRIDVYLEGITGKSWNVLVSIAKTYDEELAEAILKEVLSLSDLAKDVPVLNPPSTGGFSNGYKKENITNESKRGTSKEYRIAKLKRDHPEVAERLIAGEFKTVAAAERAAGIGKPKLTAVEKVVKAFDRLSDDEKAELLTRFGAIPATVKNVEKFHFKQMRAPTDSFEVGSEGWLEGMSMRFQSAFEKTETYGIDRLIDVIRTVLPHKPWNHIPLGNPSKRADIYFEGITGKHWNVLVSIVRLYDKNLADEMLKLV